MTIPALPISAGSSYPDPGGSAAVGVQATGFNGELLTWTGAEWGQFSNADAEKVRASVSGAGIDPSLSEIVSAGYPVAGDLRLSNIASSSNCTVTDCQRIAPDGTTLRGIRMTATGSTSMGCDVNVRAQTFATGRINTLIYRDYPSGSSGTHEFTTMVSDGSGFTNWFTSLVTMTRGGWYLHAPGDAAGSGPQKWAIGGGAPIWGTTSFNRLRFRANFPSGQTPAIEIYEVTYNQDAAKSWLSLTVDDGYDSAYTLGAPAFERFGMRASFSLIADLVGTANYMTLDQLRDLLARGHDMVVHGPIGGTGSLLNYTTPATRLAQARSDVEYHRNWIIANGLNRRGSANVYIFPQGLDQWASFDEEIKQMLNDVGFVGGRLAAVGQQTRRNLRGNTRFQHGAFGHQWVSAGTESANITALVATINSAASERFDAVLMLHKFVTVAAADPLEIQISNLETILQALADNRAAGTQEVVSFANMVYANCARGRPLA